MMEDATAVEAASLLLTVLALLNTVWSKSIREALDMSFSPHDETRAKEKDAVRLIKNTRALPLALGAWFIIFTFAPRLYEILKTAIQCLGPETCAYDELSTVFLLVQLFVCFLAIYLSFQLAKLCRKIGGSQ